MDIQRMLLVVIFAMSGFFLWNEWQKLANPQPAATQSAPATPSAGGAPAPGSTASSVPAPATPSASAPAVPSSAPAAAAPSSTVSATTGERITLESDLLRLVVNTAGGVIEEADLKTQQSTLDKSQPYQLLLNTRERVHVAQAGLIGEGLPNHKTVYVAEPGPRKMDGADTVQLRLSAPIATGPAAGGKVEQVITLKKGSYLVDVAFEITNGGQAPVTATAYYHLLRDNKMPVGE